MMNLLTPMTQIMTALGYVILGILMVWIAAHVLAALRFRFMDQTIRWRRQATHTANYIHGLSMNLIRARMKSMQEQQPNPDPDNSVLPDASSFLGCSNQIDPGENPLSWIRQQGLNLDPPLMHALQCKLENSDSIRETFLIHQIRIRARFRIAAAICPLAGAAPTMSGAMQFLSDYTQAMQSGSRLIPLDGINDALGTTWLGCILAIVAMGFSPLTHRWLDRTRDALEASVEEIHSAVMKWRETVNDSNYHDEQT